MSQLIPNLTGTASQISYRNEFHSLLLLYHNMVHFRKLIVYDGETVKSGK